MSFISITRLRLRSVRFLPAFAIHTNRSMGQVKASPGFQGGLLLPDRRWTFWTMTAWDSEASTRRFMSTGSHRIVMPLLLDWCDETSVVNWEQAEDKLPSWGEAHRRMRRMGRPSKVRKPSRQHAALAFAPPRAWTGARIAPARPV